MDVSRYGVVELSDTEMQEVRGGCEFFCALLKEAGELYQNSIEAMEAYKKYLAENPGSVGKPSAYTW